MSNARELQRIARRAHAGVQEIRAAAFRLPEGEHRARLLKAAADADDVRRDVEGQAEQAMEQANARYSALAAEYVGRMTGADFDQIDPWPDVAEGDVVAVMADPTTAYRGVAAYVDGEHVGVFYATVHGRPPEWAEATMGTTVRRVSRPGPAGPLPGQLELVPEVSTSVR